MSRLLRCRSFLRIAIAVPAAGWLRLHWTPFLPVNSFGCSQVPLKVESKIEEITICGGIFRWVKKQEGEFIVSIATGRYNI